MGESLLNIEVVLLIMVFGFIGIFYIALSFKCIDRLIRLLYDNKNYVGKLFYIFNFILCVFRVASSILLIYCLIYINLLDNKKNEQLTTLFLNILFVPEVIKFLKRQLLYYCVF
jgi:hypothetical protein